jgi:hypothetical protein
MNEDSMALLPASGVTPLLLSGWTLNYIAGSFHYYLHVYFTYAIFYSKNILISIMHLCFIKPPSNNKFSRIHAPDARRQKGTWKEKAKGISIVRLPFSTQTLQTLRQ